MSATPSPRDPANVFRISSSSDLPADQRYGHWLQTNLEGLRAVAPSRAQLQDFKGRIVSLTAPATELHDAELDGFEAERSKYHVDNDNDKLALLYVRHGQIQVRYQDGISGQAQSGQFLLFDASQPSTIRMERSRFVQVTLPRGNMQAFACPSARGHGFVRAMANCPLSRMLAMQLSHYHQLVQELDTPWYSSLLQATESLTLTVMRAACFERLDASLPSLSGLYAMAMHFIKENLADPHLNADLIARALGCGRSTLYKAFAKQGQGIAEHIRELRLQTFARLLQGPGHHLPLADLAYQCGLHDPSNLGRLFRARFDMPPSAFRDMYRQSS